MHPNPRPRCFPRRFAWIAGLILLVMGGCATELAPPFDKALVDGLSQTNTDAMIFLAGVSNGTDKATFGSRKDQYNQLIGRLDALALLAAARPMPDSEKMAAINQLLESHGATPLDNDDGTPPSAHAITKLSETLTKMRDTDQKQGVTPLEVLAFRGQLLIYFDQAITYENFLQR